jgi:hypothetical protein
VEGEINPWLHPRVDAFRDGSADREDMTAFDYLLNLVLVGLVVLQLRGRRLDRRALVLPLVLVAWAASQYLHAVPTSGNDGVLVFLGVAAGALLGTSSGLLTTVYRGTDGMTMARATLAAGGLWVVGMGARVGFSLFVQYGGRPAVARFSAEHHLTGAGWVAALVLMALVEVVCRTVVLGVRAWPIRVAGLTAYSVG